MTTYAARIFSVVFFGMAVQKGIPAVSAESWPVVVDAITMILLSVVLWFAMPPGAERLQAPAVGTRSLRIGAYATLLGLAALMMFPSWLGEHACRGTLTPLVAVAMAVSLLHAEAPPPMREGEARA